jgi:hypothetical protein
MGSILYGASLLLRSPKGKVSVYLVGGIPLSHKSATEKIKK